MLENEDAFLELPMMRFLHQMKNLFVFLELAQQLMSRCCAKSDGVRWGWGVVIEGVLVV